MADVKQIELNSTYYPAKDVTARSLVSKALADIADEFSAVVSYSVGDLAIYQGDLYKCTTAHEGAWDANDFTAVTVDELMTAMKNGLQTDIDNKILYFTSQTVSVGTSAQIMRIPASDTDSRITTDTIVIGCLFGDLNSITSNVSWQSYAGYVTFSGTCTSATTANVILGQKGN